MDVTCLCLYQLMSALIFDRDEPSKLSPENSSFPSIQVTLGSSLSYTEASSHQKHPCSTPLISLKNHNTSAATLCSLLKQSHLCSKTTTQSLNKSDFDLHLRPQKTTCSQITEKHTSGCDSSETSETDSEGRRLENIKVMLSKSMCQRPKEHTPPKMLLLTKEALCPEFLKVCQEHLMEQSCSKKITDCWEMSNLYSKFRTLPMSDPFIEAPLPEKPTQLESIATIFQSWLFNYSEFSDLILSFDFLLSHPSMLLCLVFYWVKSQSPVNPLVSAPEKGHIIQHKNTLRHSILRIMADEITLRGRELTRNPVLFKLLSGFFRYATDNPPSDLLPSLRQLVTDTWKILIKQNSLQEELKKTMLVESKHDAELLEHIYENYQSKDKIIKDRLQDIVEVFTETDKSAILLTPLSNYYGVGLGEHSLRDLGNRYSQLSCWLLSLVINRTKTNGRQAIEYVTRFIELLEQFDRTNNYQSAIFFGGLISNIRSLMPNLWSRTLESICRPDLEQHIADIVNSIQRPIFSERVENSKTLFSNTEVYKLVEAAREKFHKQYLNINFHKRVQTIGKNILACRRLLEQPYQGGKKASRMNLNQRFIGTYIYEILQREPTKEAAQRFEELKKDARKADRGISFSLLRLY